MNKNEVKISKFLSLVLRHKPETIGLKLDPNGWAYIDELIEKSNKHGMSFNKEVLDYVVGNNNKKRFAYSYDGKMIRASQGHSIDVELGYKPIVPPAILYHGTAQRFLASIFEKGLLKQKRQHVHLSKDFQTAVNVGKRHGNEDYIVIQIYAGRMVEDGYEIFISDNGVYLTDHVPKEYFGAITKQGI